LINGDGGGAWPTGEPPSCEAVEMLRHPFNRRSAVAWARAIAEDQDVVFLDTETTGLGAHAEIVDIAVIAADGRVLLDSLVRPVGPIPPEATLIHGITEELVARAPPWRDLVTSLRDLLESRTVVVYNAEFDRAMVTRCTLRLGLTPITADWQCAMRAYAAYRGERSRGRPGFRLHRLDHVATALGFAPIIHRARSDAEVCRALVLAMAEETLTRRGR
jgi:DNA polymerase-3 subunit epsilon